MTVKFSLIPSAVPEYYSFTLLLTTYHAEIIYNLVTAYAEVFASAVSSIKNYDVIAGIRMKSYVLLSHENVKPRHILFLIVPISYKN